MLIPIFLLYFPQSFCNLPFPELCQSSDKQGKAQTTFKADLMDWNRWTFREGKHSLNGLTTQLWLLDAGEN